MFLPYRAWLFGVLGAAGRMIFKFEDNQLPEEPATVVRKPPPIHRGDICISIAIGFLPVFAEAAATAIYVFFSTPLLPDRAVAAAAVVLGQPLIADRWLETTVNNVMCAKAVGVVNKFQPPGRDFGVGIWFSFGLFGQVIEGYAVVYGWYGSLDSVSATFDPPDTRSRKRKQSQEVLADTNAIWNKLQKLEAMINHRPARDIQGCDQSLLVQELRAEVADLGKQLASCQKKCADLEIEVAGLREAQANVDDGGGVELAGIREDIKTLENRID
ncbi:hypothetical protein FMUND_15663, partial [Fusarium mundagurra]